MSIERTGVVLDGTDKDSGTEPRAGAYFPRRYVTDFFRFLEHHKSDIEPITYGDLPWNDDWNFSAGYPMERKAWNAELADGKRDRNKAYVLLQYDVDSVPCRTVDLLQEPTQLLCPANIMIFNRRIDRRRLKTTGVLDYTDYDLDEALLRGLCSRGFVVGYHTNAYEQALFHVEQALAIFDRDIRELSDRFPISFFSAHGGIPGPDGRNNCHLPFHPAWQTKLRWVHNGYSPHFSGQFSDGGHNSPVRDPEKRDLRDFVRKFKPGRRYRILLHPQYYSDMPQRSSRYGGTAWYDDMMRVAEASPAESLWKDVRLG